MASSRRLTRDQATGELLALLERICTDDKYGSCVTKVSVFGSYARGALTVGDVDIDIEHQASLHPEVMREAVDSLTRGKDWLRPFRKAFGTNKPALQVLFGADEMLQAAITVFERGDSYDTAAARVHAIASDAGAGRAERDAVHPVIEPLVDDLTRPSRIVLTEMASRGWVELAVIDLPDAEFGDVDHEQFRLVVESHWSRTSPLARAARAAGRHLLARGVALDDVTFMDRHLSQQLTTYVVECREQHLQRFVYDMGHRDIAEWLFVIRPQRKQPLRALQIRAADTDALSGIESVDAWLSQHAPHIARIG